MVGKSKEKKPNSPITELNLRFYNLRKAKDKNDYCNVSRRQPKNLRRRNNGHGRGDEHFSRIGTQYSIGTYDGQTIELNDPLITDGTLQFFTWNDDGGKKAFWHSSAHVLAQAILHFYPEAKLTIGPAIEKGFYYDVDFGDEMISEKDFEKIEKQMMGFARQKFEFKLRAVTKAEALEAYKNNPYKTEIIENLEDGTITFCDHADFTDLCRGGHIPHTGYIKAVKIMNVAGAYWRGDENKPQLTRVYGVSFMKAAELEGVPRVVGGSEKTRPQKTR